MSQVSEAVGSASTRQVVGVIQQKDASHKIIANRKIFADQEVLIGRDKARCDYILDDPFVSKKHLRIYTIVYENDAPSEVGPLVYAEDLSRYGTYWNGSLIGKGNGGVLLSQEDTLRLSSKTYFRFTHMLTDQAGPPFDQTQEQEMKHFCKDYVITDRLLGAGAFGRVFMAVMQFQHIQIACKVVDLRKLRLQSRTTTGRSEQPAAAEDVDSSVQLRKVKLRATQHRPDNGADDKLKIYYREAEILANISHPNIIGLHKVYVTDNTIYMFQDLVTAGDLFSYLERKNGKLLDLEAAVIVRQILLALEYLHKNNIVHRDLKPDNVLMTTVAVGCRVILTDFGAARRIGNERSRMSTIIGTAEYTAPEILGRNKTVVQKKGYTKAVDMWALGCVTVVLLTGGSAFADPYTNEYSERLANECNLVSLEKSQDWKGRPTRPKAFVGRLLVLDEQRRMTATEALQDPWFANEFHRIDFEELYERTIKHWRPRAIKAPLIQYLGMNHDETMPNLQENIRVNRRSKRRTDIPIEPPYKPFPKTMYQMLLPKRQTPLYTISDEAKVAIMRDWSSIQTSNGLSYREAHSLPAPPSTAHHFRPEGVRTFSTNEALTPIETSPLQTTRVTETKTMQSKTTAENPKALEQTSLTIRTSKDDLHSLESCSRASPELYQLNKLGTMSNMTMSRDNRHSTLGHTDHVHFIKACSTIVPLARLSTARPLCWDHEGFRSFSAPPRVLIPQMSINYSNKLIVNTTDEDPERGNAVQGLILVDDLKLSAQHGEVPPETKEEVDTIPKAPNELSSDQRLPDPVAGSLVSRLQHPSSSQHICHNTANSNKKRKHSIFDIGEDEVNDGEGGKKKKPKKTWQPANSYYSDTENRNLSDSYAIDNEEVTIEAPKEGNAQVASVGKFSRYFLPRM